MTRQCQVVERVGMGVPWFRACHADAVAQITLREKQSGELLEMWVCLEHAQQARSRVFPRAGDYREEGRFPDGWSPAKLADVFFNGRKA